MKVKFLVQRTGRAFDGVRTNDSYTDQFRDQETIPIYQLYNINGHVRYLISLRA